MEPTGSGLGHRCTGVAGLTAFVDTLGSTGDWIDIVETYEVLDEQEVPRIDLSIYGDHGGYELAEDKRRKLAGERLQWLLTALAKESKTFVFEVWLDQAD